ncbi:hypothetical protein [Paenibacillus roseipurpureus]|uniref:Uncharacterized protein n=1 Tax=Paenibacillus roseopurpureus TaxID=2918901 RepID=A0AA96LRX7_9BACL|nr:hypothetical protein [Paenibacillus sp. MBLB1832]WNR46935.1 hypothetical protein MJB10_12890 [Paenibacillus sp. MBLB1832]
MELEQQRAKALFTQFRGSTILMHREGVYNEYKSYLASKEMELQWVQEMIDRFTRELSIRDWEVLSSLASIARDFKDVRVLTNVVSFASKHIKSADSLVKLKYAESIVDMLTSVKAVISQETLFESLKTTKIILDDIMLNPLILDPGHELKQFNLKDKKSLNLRANNSIEQLKSFMS